MHLQGVGLCTSVSATGMEVAQRVEVAQTVFSHVTFVTTLRDRHCYLPFKFKLREVKPLHRVSITSENLHRIVTSHLSEAEDHVLCYDFLLFCAHLFTDLFLLKK